MLETRFWRNAANSLPPHVRERYAIQLEAAERLDLALDAAIEASKRAEASIRRILRRLSAHAADLGNR
jgi:hypothetical protein